MVERIWCMALLNSWKNGNFEYRQVMQFVRRFQVNSRPIEICTLGNPGGRHQAILTRSKGIGSTFFRLDERMDQ
jgi:hypothetical protein